MEESGGNRLLQHNQSRDYQDTASARPEPATYLGKSQIDVSRNEFFMDKTCAISGSRSRRYLAVD